MQTALFENAVMTGAAVFNQSGTHRFMLSRTWDAEKGYMLVIACNPSTATADVLDNTCAKLVRFAKRLNLGGLYVCNLWALVSTDPAPLKTHPSPTGDPDNLRWILELATSPSVKKVVCAWGGVGVKPDGGARAAEVREMLRENQVETFAFRVTGSVPWHPLYLPSNTELVRF